MTRTRKFHSAKGGVHHTETECQTGNNIEPENRVRGDGGLPLCQECARLVAAAQSRQFRVANGWNVPAPTEEDPRAERRFDIDDQVAETDLAGVDPAAIAEALAHGELEWINPPAVTPATEE